LERDLTLAFFAIVIGASGTYLLLPHKHGARKPRNVHLAGAGLGGLALLLYALFWTPPGPWISGLFFYAFAFSAIIGGVLTVTSCDPIHSALWFAAVVLSTSGLFLLAGAQFLAAGTVIVYAGAIIVTFLFVIMLAQMEGRAPYDRAARSPFGATWICFVLLFGVLWSLFHVRAQPPPSSVAAVPNPTPGIARQGPVETRLPRSDSWGFYVKPRAGQSVAEVLDRAVRPTARLTDASGQPKRHVAGLGETLYTDHLVTVELAGALLFVALIGALAIATPKPPIRPGDRAVPSAANVGH
jgi:NADH-quinone oxidoreductase subunit J